jgi:hypothetical protein
LGNAATINLLNLQGVEAQTRNLKIIFFMPIKCKCGAVDNYRQEQSGPHIKAICNSCGSYIQFLPQGFTDDTIMFYGKYKGRRLGDIPWAYLIWLDENTKVNGSLKLYIQSIKTKLHEAR